MKKYLGIILCLTFVLTGCSKGTESSVSETTKEVTESSAVGEISDSDLETNPIDVDVKSEIDDELGLASAKIDQLADLTDEQKTVLQYFDNDYLSIDNYEFMQRYPQVYEGAQITCSGTVKKIITSNSDEYQLLIWIGKTNDQFFYRGGLDLTEKDYENYLNENANNYVVIKGHQTSTRLIEGDNITLYGRYKSLDTYDVDGTSLTIPTVDVYRAYISTDSMDELYGTVKFNADYIKSVAKAVFGNDISVRNAVLDEDYGNSMSWRFEEDPFMIVEPDNQTNAKFTKFRFYMRDGYIEDAKEASRNDLLDTTNSLIQRSIEFAPDFKHFYLFIFDTELKTLTVEYYNNDFQKQWSREFEDTVNAVYDYTNTNIYLVANNDLYIINTENGEDRYEPSFIGEKTGIRKLKDSILFTTDYSSADAIMKTDLEGNIIWKTNLDDGYQFQQVQFINDKIVFECVRDGYHYVVLNQEDGTVDIDAVSLDNQSNYSASNSILNETVYDAPQEDYIETPENIGEILTSPGTYYCAYYDNTDEVKSEMRNYTMEYENSDSGETQIGYIVEIYGKTYHVVFMFRDNLLNHINYSE